MTQKHSHHGVVKHPLHLHSKKKHKKKVKHLSVVPMMFRETESQSVRRKPRATHRLLKFKSDSPDGRVHVWGQEETIMVREDEQHPGRFMAAPPELHDDEDELSKLEDEVDESSDSESDPSASVNGDTPQSSEDKEADEVAEAAEETEPSVSGGSVVNIYQGGMPSEASEKSPEEKSEKTDSVQGVIQNAADQENEQMRTAANKAEMDLKEEEEAADKEMKELIAEEKQEAANAQAEVSEAEKLLEGEMRRRDAKLEMLNQKEETLEKKKEATEDKLEAKAHQLETEVQAEVGELKREEKEKQTQLDENDEKMEEAARKASEDVAKVDRAEKEKESAVAAESIIKGCEAMAEQKLSEENCGECPCAGPHSYAINPHDKPSKAPEPKMPEIDVKVETTGAPPPAPLQVKAPLDLDKPACPEDQATAPAAGPTAPAAGPTVAAAAPASTAAPAEKPPAAKQ